MLNFICSIHLFKENKKRKLKFDTVIFAQILSQNTFDFLEMSHAYKVNV